MSLEAGRMDPDGSSVALSVVKTSHHRQQFVSRQAHSEGDIEI